MLWVAGEGSAQDPAISTLMPMLKPMPIPYPYPLHPAFLGLCGSPMVSIGLGRLQLQLQLQCWLLLLARLLSSITVDKNAPGAVLLIHSMPRSHPSMLFFFSLSHSIPMSSYVLILSIQILDQSYSLHQLYIHVPGDHYCTSRLPRGKPLCPRSRLINVPGLWL